MTFSKITGTGSYLPEKIVTNKDLEKMIDTTDEWITKRVGIRQRHVLSEEETTATMGAEAARKALEAAQLEPQDLDMIIVGTSTPEMAFPSTAISIQKLLDVPGVPAFDISAACAGFIYGMSMADQSIKAGQCKNILVVGTEAMSRILDWTDRSTCVLFGDGAGAVVLSASEEPGIHATEIHADGRYRDLLYLYNSFHPAVKEGEKPALHMSGNEVFKTAVNSLGSVVESILKNNNMSKSELDWLIPHQANLRIIGAVAKKLDMSLDQVILTVQDHGNTSAASVPLAMDHAVREGRVKRGHKILLEAFGGGFAWGAALLTY